MNIDTFYDESTNTLTYVVSNPATKDAVVIDPVLDYDPASSNIAYDSVDEVTKFLRDNELTLQMILETHAHADHLSGSQALKERFPEAKTAIGRRITEVQQVFKDVFDLPRDFPTDGRQFDHLFENGEVFHIG